MKPRLLDLFCGAGGAAEGYHRAGFEVVGVDINPQPNYPFPMVVADALEWFEEWVLSGHDVFDAVHASPPCQEHSALASHFTGNLPHKSGWMLPATIEVLREYNKPYVVENVMGAKPHMPGAFTLCGRSFGIKALRRHRLFLVEPMNFLVPPCACDKSTAAIGVYGDLAKNDRPVRHSKDGHVSMRAGVQTARDLLDCQWMSGPELSQAIPPAYTEFIGSQLLAHITQEVAA